MRVMLRQRSSSHSRLGSCSVIACNKRLASQFTWRCTNPRKTFLTLSTMQPKPNRKQIQARKIKTCLTPFTMSPRPKSMAKDPMRLTAAPSTEPMFVKSKAIWREDMGNTIFFGIHLMVKDVIQQPHHTQEATENRRGPGYLQLHSHSPSFQVICKPKYIFRQMNSADYVQLTVSMFTLMLNVALVILMLNGCGPCGNDTYRMFEETRVQIKFHL